MLEVIQPNAIEANFICNFEPRDAINPGAKQSQRGRQIIRIIKFRS